MQVLKITGEGLITSFRYPHFMQGVQPTFEMPPPATLYGHVCSALGEWVEPAGLRFAVHFTFERRVDELEHTHVLAPASGKLPGSDTPKVLAGAVNPFVRTVLFRPRLVLYLNRPEWAARFRSPRYVVVLGRSQDLFTYTKVEVVELERTDHAYLEHTLLPHRLNRYTGRGIAVLMPQWLDYQDHRRPTFRQYVMLNRRVHSREFLRYADEPPLQFWVDPTSAEVHGDRLGLVFLSWSDGDEPG